MFAVEVETVPEKDIEALKRLAESATWRTIPGREYQTAEMTESLPGYKRAFFIKIPPGCAVHRHTDNIPERTDHIVVQTNPHCLNWWADDKGDRSEHLEAGKRYFIPNRSLEHWATNDGETDRIHLLIEY